MFLRYPGSKAKLWRHIANIMPDSASTGGLFATGLRKYCEPFYGSGAIGWHVMNSLRAGVTDILINDIDPGMAAIWKMVLDAPQELTDKILSYTPTVDDFYRFKKRDGDRHIDPAQLAFEKIVIHQSSRSGIGCMAGVQGGINQNSEYPIDCRWKPERMAEKIWNYHHLMKSMKSVSITCRDFEGPLERLEDGDFAYLDPPYYVQGGSLYKHSMSHEDHVRLRDVLRDATYTWVLSYDKCDEVISMYSSWARIETFRMMATVGPVRRKNDELLITNREVPHG